MGIVKERGLNK